MFGFVFKKQKSNTEHKYHQNRAKFGNAFKIFWKFTNFHTEFWILKIALFFSKTRFNKYYASLLFWRIWRINIRTQKQTLRFTVIFIPYGIRRSGFVSQKEIWIHTSYINSLKLQRDLFRPYCQKLKDQIHY